jgi:hypothetical protein
MDVRASMGAFLKDEPFDLVCCFHVLEHIPDPISFAQGMRKLGAPQGHCVIEVPSVDDGLLTLFDISAFRQFYWQAAHLFCFSKATLTEVLMRAGWEAPVVSGLNRYGLRNHLHWLHTGKPGSGDEFSQIISDNMDTEYRAQLINQDISDTLWAVLNQQ